MPDYSDIFIATPSTAIEYDIKDPTHENISLMDLTDYEVCALWSCLERSKFDPDKYELKFTEIDSDAILYQIPHLLMEQLASLDQQKIATTAALWIEFEEVRYTLAQAEQTIEDLKMMAQKALAQQQSLFLIFC